MLCCQSVNVALSMMSIENDEYDVTNAIFDAAMKRREMHGHTIIYSSGRRLFWRLVLFSWSCGRNSTWAAEWRIKQIGIVLLCRGNVIHIWDYTGPKISEL